MQLLTQIGPGSKLELAHPNGNRFEGSDVRLLRHFGKAMEGFEVIELADLVRLAAIPDEFSKQGCLQLIVLGNLSLLDECSLSCSILSLRRSVPA